MGCFHAKESLAKPSNQITTSDGKTYSWSQRKAVDESLYVIENLDDEKIFRIPGSLTDTPFNVSQCRNSTVASLNSHTACTISDCTGCKIFVGPTNGSISVLNCSDCTIVCASMQFRTRDCHNLKISLYCSTQPSIESSNNLHFCCFNYSYPELEGQFEKSGLSVFNNIWYQIFDFSSCDSYESNYRVCNDLRQDESFKSLIWVPAVECSLERSCVPKTEGHLTQANHATRLVIFFVHFLEQEYLLDRLHQFLTLIDPQECYIVRTRRITKKEIQSTPNVQMHLLPELEGSWEDIIAVQVAANDLETLQRQMREISVPADKFQVVRNQETTRQLIKIFFK